MSMNSVEISAYAIPLVSIGLPAPIIFLPFICDYDPLQLFLEMALNVGFGTRPILDINFDVVNFILCTLAFRPNSDADKFRERCLVSRMARLQLKTCPPVGFAVGFFIHGGMTP
ncbi:unnamed protein product [Orchesella dallaii]|uniref:Uncharacterized protein n=1 Tax=Orchesella dallaii TaxID=48710 RepID=A0ABP1PJ33_9HEXA